MAGRTQCPTWARDTNPTWEEKLVSPIPDPRNNEHLALSFWFLQLLTSESSRGKQTKEHKAHVTGGGRGRTRKRSCGSVLRTRTRSSRDMRRGGALGGEMEEFLRPEKRGKHVTELHESFIRL